MKKIYLLILSFVLLFLSGCNDMLDIKPVNTMIPQSVADYESLLVGGYPKTEFFMKTEFMTDNVYANLNTISVISTADEAWFLWAPSHQLPTAETDAYWGELYRSVYYANSILDEFNGRTPAEDEAALFETVKGEAYALRAYAYFYLVNYYAENYAPENLDKPGVPMPLTAEDVNVNTQGNVREPVGKVWEQINTDLDEAERLLAGKPTKGNFRFNYTSLQALRARVYLFTGQWDKAIASATDVISTKRLFDMNNLQAHIDAEVNEAYAFGGDYGFIDSDYRNEVLLFLGGKANNNIFYYERGMAKPSWELLALAIENDTTVLDYRFYIYYSFMNMSLSGWEEVGQTVYRMYGNQGTPTYYVGLKVSEAYVTRAEAYMRQATPDKASAVRDLNNLLRNRIISTAFTELTVADFPTNEALLKRILEERRLETSFDCGMRWLDLRRLGKPEIRHAYKNGTEYVLKQGDPRYVLQIPLSEQNNSPGMPLNPRD